MQVAPPAASGADREAPRQMRFRARRKCCDLLMANVNPFHRFLATNRVGDGVEAVPDDSVDTFDTRGCQGGDELVCDGVGHKRCSVVQTKSRPECFWPDASTVDLNATAQAVRSA